MTWWPAPASPASIRRPTRDRNLVNREFSDLAGMSPDCHSKATSQVLTRFGRSRYIYREPELPMESALVREYLESTEVYERRPLRRRGSVMPRVSGFQGKSR